FYAPLVYDLGTLLMALGLDVTTAFRLLFAIGLSLSGAAAYAWVRGRLASRTAALLAAAAYVYAPYALVDVYRRRPVAGAFPFALLPANLLALSRLIAAPGAGRLLLSGGAIGLLICTHNAMAYFFLPLLALYALLLSTLAPARPRALVPCLGAALLGLALSA